MAKYTLTNSFLVKAQVEPLFKATLPGGLGNIFSACLILMFLYGSSQQYHAVILSAVISLLSLLRILVSSHYLNKCTYSINSYIYAHVLFTFLIGLCWAGYAYMQLHSESESLRSLVILVNFGLIAASIATLSTWMPAYLAYMIPQSLAIFYVFLNIDTGYNMQMGVALLIFVGIMITTSIRFNKRFKTEIQLTYNNKQLINDLNSEIGIREEVQLELEHGKMELENKVEERTKELVDINLSLESVIDKKEKAEQSLQYLAYHDELTGLPNKSLLVDRINQSIKTSSRDDQKMAILFLDLDRFKTINDSLGHTIGDDLLKEVSARLHKTLRNHDTISRNGGDEFVVVLERLKNTDEAIHVAKKVINCLTDTFHIHSHRIHIGASIGISIYPSDGDTPLILLRNADTAMYRAKQAGGNQLQFYDKSMSNQLHDRLVLENELHTALANNEFYMVYQPQVNCKTGLTTGFESLMRWNNKNYGEIGPDRFIPLLEETGLIYDVGQWIVNEVINFIAAQEIHDIGFSINLSALQCNNFDFIDFVKGEIRRAGINASQLEFEITESLLIKDFEKTKLFLDELHSIGCSIALDDFGTGYTSMSYLARLPIDVIKIDKSLVRNIHNNESLRSIVKAIITMSSSLGKTNVFEGIETNAELAEIKKLNGTIIQGYLFSKPLKTVDIDGWLHAVCDIKQA